MIDAAKFVFDGVWDSMPHLRCEARLGRHEVSKAKINRIELLRVNTEEGQMLSPASPVLEFYVADAPKPDKDHGGIAAGDTCEVKQAGGSEWRKFRVSGTQRLGESILRLTLEAEFA